jgi:hypothetical protein
MVSIGFIGLDSLMRTMLDERTSIKQAYIPGLFPAFIPMMLSSEGEIGKHAGFIP